MSAHASIATVAALAILTLADGRLHASSSFPETTALQKDFATIQAKLDSLIKRTERVEAQIDAASKKVKEAQVLVKSIDTADDKLASVIKELKSLSAIPQLKMLPPAIKLLEGIKKQLHAARLKGDTFEKEVLRKLEAQLKDLKVGIVATTMSVRKTQAEIKLSQMGVSETQRLIVERGTKPGEVRTLEDSSRVARAGSEPVLTGIAELDRASADLEASLKSLTASLTAMTALKPGITQFNKDLKPFSDVSAELKKVMTKRISVNILGKDHGFTVRQILDGPKNVADIVLKPLQDLANAAIAEVMKAFKLKIEAPDEIREIAKKIEAIGNEATKFTKSISENMKLFDAQFLTTYQQTLAALPKSKSK